MNHFLLSIVFILSIQNPETGNWPEYRGPSANGHSAAKGLPLSWSENQNVKWKVAIHGKGWSSPVVWGDQIWLTTATPDGREMFVLCIDRNTGKLLLDRKLFENPEPDPINDVNSYASPSPVIEEGRVYVHFGSYGTACFDTKTIKPVWIRRDLPCRHSVGPGSSPVLFRDLLILTMDGIDVQYMTALDKRTGKTIWRTDRGIGASRGTNGGSGTNEGNKSFNTPAFIEFGGKTQMVSTGAKAVVAYDPATGSELWRAAHGGYSNSSRPLFGNGMVFINTGYDRAELFAVRLGGSGDVTSSNVVWKLTKSVPFKPSALLLDGLYYMVTDGGILTCLEAATGQQVWQERIGGHFSASPVYAEGRIYLFSEEGKTTVIKPGRKLEVLGENVLSDGFMASAAIAGKGFYLRTKTHLYRIEE